MHDRTHASFFSGVGGLDLGLERAGWRTVSFSEIDPYASAVLAERWPGIPNLGDILGVSRDLEQRGGDTGHQRIAAEQSAQPHGSASWQSATLWSGGFPCQDLSVAGKRAGFAGARSSLAFAFLDLVAAHRPPIVLLENVPGLLSSHGGRDFGTLLGTLAELRYGWAYRILDARHFGVPQRRRRVFIVALDTERGPGAERAAEVLSVGTRCGRHPATGHATGEGAAERAGDGTDIAGTVTGPSPNRGWPGNFEAEWAYTATAAFGQFAGGNTVGNLSARDYKSANHLVSPPSDPGGVRAPDGLAGRVDDLAPTLRVGPARPQDGGPGDTVPIVAAYRKSARPTEADGSESWVDDGLANTLNSFDVGDIRTTHLALNQATERDAAGLEPDADSLPLGLDSHRYRCCGNGVVSSVAEWIGLRLAALG